MADALFFGEMPDNYEKYLVPNAFVPYAEDLAERVDDGTAILEIACGTGVVSALLISQLADDGHLIVTDISEEMLRRTRHNVAAAPNVTYQTADACALPFDDDQFSDVICGFGAMFFQDKVQGFREIRRVLKPDGKLSLSCWGSLDRNPFGAVPSAYLSEQYGEPAQFLQVPFHYHDHDVISADILAAGFDQVACIDFEVEQSVDIDELARGVIFGNPTANEIRSHGDDPEQVVPEIADRFRQLWGHSAVASYCAVMVECR
ncbi:MAG: class I SAM-dependent methyltransferase [Pseudomonadota bacterium]